MSHGMLFTVVPLTCLVIGFYDGFFGPGTGSMFIIAFHYLLKMDLVSSSANSKTFNFASNIGALVAFVIAGKVIYLLALPLVACNILGNHLGSALAIRKGNDVVRKALVFSMLCLFASLGVKYLA
ncbi:TPA: TSUP family transporter [Serratia marcescens]|uniref:TSUP family transporter n=1 Tax=Serratia bockelmannii TaxID=2703793 RepID=UPI0038384F09